MEENEEINYVTSDYEDESRISPPHLLSPPKWAIGKAHS